MLANVCAYRLNGDIVEAISELAGLPLRYSLDGHTWSDYRPGIKLQPAQTVVFVAT